MTAHTRTPTHTFDLKRNAEGRWDIYADSRMVETGLEREAADHAYRWWTLNYPSFPTRPVTEVKQ